MLIPSSMAATLRRGPTMLRRAVVGLCARPCEGIPTHTSVLAKSSGRWPQVLHQRGNQTTSSDEEQKPTPGAQDSKDEDEDIPPWVDREESKWESFEPSGARGVPADHVGTRHALLSSKKDKQSTTGYTILQGGGVLTALGAGGVLAYKHLWPLVTMDMVWGGAAVSGLGVALLAQNAKTELKSDGAKNTNAPREQQFEFQLLNDDARFHREAKQLERMEEAGAPWKAVFNWSATVQKQWASARLEQAQEDAKVTVDARHALVKQVSAKLNAKMRLEQLTASLRPRTFVIVFNDMGRNPKKLSTSEKVAQFGDAVSLVISVASKFDEVVIKVTSPGGSVIDYGLASSHLLRLKRANLQTTACVDTVAASGGYMMACVADKLVAAPFAFLGSIGVVSQMINIHKVLKKNDVDTLLFTAGKFKRTVTPFTETTQEAIDKTNKDIEEIHGAFKEHVSSHREGLTNNIEEVATGETWLALQAKPKGLVDELMTSDEYLRSRMRESDVLLLKPYKRKKTLTDVLEKLGAEASATLATLSSPLGALQRALNVGPQQRWHQGLGANDDGTVGSGLEEALPRFQHQHQPSRDYHFK